MLVGSFRADTASGRAAATLTACPGGTYPTLQSAVNAANPGDTINACAASFAEQLVIAKSVIIVGAGQSQTTIKAPVPLIGTQDIVTVSGSSGVDVGLSALTISGPGNTGDCSGLLSGVFVRDGAHATIRDTAITAIRENPLNGCQKGAAIRVGRAALQTSGRATITGTRITDYQKTGIIVDGSGSQAEITGNTVTGGGQLDIIAQNGIQVSRSATATVTGNTVSGNRYSGSASASSTGILLYGDLGEVTVSNNTVSDNDEGIVAATVSPKPGPVTVSGNKVSGGDRGITLGATTGVVVETNTVTDAGTFGVEAADDTSGNTFRGNSASGTSGEGHFDCRDGSSGDKTANTANTWTDDTGATASPEAICTPKNEQPPEQPGEPATPPVVEPPTVIVLPPIPDTPEASEQPEPTPPVQQPGAAPEQPAPAEQPPAAAPNPEQPAQPTGEVAEAAADEIVTTMKTKQLSSCLVTLNAHGKQQTLVARGVARAPKGRSGVLVIRVGVQPNGQRLLAQAFGGVIVDVRAACRTASKKTVRTKAKTARALLAIEHIVTPPGSWVPDQPILTPVGHRFLAQLRSRMVQITRIRCDGYTATWIPSPADPHTLSLARAQLVCSQLKRTGITVQPRLVPHGRANPLASNDTEAGRTINRRVAVTFVHRVATRTSGG
jgi:parallel beta-helix repeat protein